MSLEENIRKQYQQRTNTESVYSSVYAKLADKERYRQFKKMLAGKTMQKKILEIGAGQGHNVPLLEHCGFDRSSIFLNELLPDRIEIIRKDLPEIPLFPGDAITTDFGTKFDFVFQSTVFTSILKQEDREKLARKMWDLLLPGGYIIWYDFIYNNPVNRNVRKVDVRELKSLFPKATSFQIRKITLAPPIGRRVGKLYRLFNLPILRSHVIALVKKSED